LGGVDEGQKAKKTLIFVFIFAEKYSRKDSIAIKHLAGEYLPKEKEKTNVHRKSNAALR
jgi:hypothetical protein